MHINKYLRMFLEMNCAASILPLFSRYNNSAKEVTESFAMVEAAKKYFPDLSKYAVIVVGDGRSPRTGAMFAYMTQALVLSIDPNFDLDFWGLFRKNQRDIGFPVKRLILYCDSLINIHFSYKDFLSKRKLLFVFPHSHADMREMFVAEKLYDYIGIISMPCCVPIPVKYKRIPHIVYEDKHVLSAKREIHVWQDFKPTMLK